MVATAENLETQVTEKKAEGLVREYEIMIPAAALSSKVTEKLKAQQANFSMKGFRKGKAPLSLMQKMFGKSLLGESMQELVDGSVQNVVSDNAHRPAMQPNIKLVNENYEEGQDLQIAVNYELLPDVPEVDFASIQIEKLTVAVNEDAVTEALTKLAADASDYEPREAGAAAQDGDQVVIDFVGKLNGEEFEGGSAEDFPLVLGSNQFVPGFEEQLVGVKVGDTPEVALTMPENYGNATLAGQAVVFVTTVKEVRLPKPAELNDEFAKRFGVDDLDSLKTNIRDRVSGEYEQATRAHMKRKLLDALDEKVDFELPPTMLDIEAKQVAHQLWHDENPEVEGHDHPEVEPTEDHIKIARRRVMLGLLLAHLGSESEISVTEDELRSAMFAQARQYPGREREFLEWLQSNQQAINEIQAPIFEDKVVDHIISKVTVTEKSLTREELEAALEALENEAV